MDGKLRIARLRNEEKWKRQGIDIVAVRKAHEEQLKELVAKLKNQPVPRKAIKPKNIQQKNHKVFDEPWLTFPSTHDTRWYKVSKWLRKKGWTELGSGCYSTVYGKPGKDKVIKISRNLDNWIDYIQWGAKHGYVGTFVPRVYSWKRWADGGSIAVVEKMDKTLRQLDKTHDLNLVELFVHHNEHPRMQKMAEEILPGGMKFFNHLRKDLHASDIYGKNMMIRPDGSFCVTDPCCGRIKTTATRLKSKDLSSASCSLRYYDCNYRCRNKRITQSYKGLVHCM